MSNNVTDLRDTIVPKSDQLNAEQLLGGPITITVTEVRRGGGEDQPVVIHYEGEGGRPYKPCKSMRKILVFAWGPDGREWIGRSMTLYNRPDVKFGGEEVGGIRISHLSHIQKDIAVALTSTRGRKEQTRIKRLDEADTVDGSRKRLEAAARGGMKSLQAAWGAIPAEHKRVIGPRGCPDEYKQIAQQASSGSDSAKSEPASGDPQAPTLEEVLAGMQSAQDVDALDAAYDLARMLPEADQRELMKAYDLRRDELDLAAK